MKKEEKLDLQRVYSLIEDLEVDLEDTQRDLRYIKSQVKNILKEQEKKKTYAKKDGNKMKLYKGKKVVKVISIDEWVNGKFWKYPLLVDEVDEDE